MRGVALLQKHGVEWNALAVVNRRNADDPAGFYRFFRSIGCRFLQFTPVVERILPHDDGRQLASAARRPEPRWPIFRSRPEQWGRFTCALFDEWVVGDVGAYLRAAVRRHAGQLGGRSAGRLHALEELRSCGALEFNGDLYACDHFVFPEYKLGNILETPLTELMRGPRQTAFGDAKLRALPTQCRRCRYLFACNGECPRNRFERTREGRAG